MRGGDTPNARRININIYTWEFETQTQTNMTKKEFQNPSGGLNAKGRKHFGVKAPVSKGKNPRRVSFAARFAGMKGAMKDEKGKPTRKALALKKWGFSSVAAARNFVSRNKA